MPRTYVTPDILQRLNALQDQVDRLRRMTPTLTGGTDEIPWYPAAWEDFVFESDTAWVDVWETAFAPRTSTLALGLSVVGDQVGATNTGGQWRLLLNGVEASIGTVPANYTITQSNVTVDLGPYQGLAVVPALIQVCRTSGASTGGRFGTGGSIGVTFRYARLV